jgi:hypothetical protein
MYYVYYYRNIDFAVAAAPAADDAIECVNDKVVPVSMTMCSVVGTIALVLMTMGTCCCKYCCCLLFRRWRRLAVSVVPSLVVLP